MSPSRQYDMIVTIVPRDTAETVIEASRSAGAEGGTILCGRGTGVHEHQKILGIPIEPEKDVVFTIVPRDISDAVVDAIVAATDLNKPGHGIGFVVPVSRMVGISHAPDI